LVFHYNILNDNLSETFGEVIWKYKIDELIYELCNTLNKLINRNDISVKTTELIETLKTIENCTSCKDNTGKCNLDGIHKSINEIESYLVELEKGNDVIDKLNDRLSRTDN